MSFSSRLMRPAMAALCVAIAGVLFSCGTDERGVSPALAPEQPSVPGALAAHLITERDVRLARAGSADRAFLLWWQALQYDNLDYAHEHLSNELRRQRPRSAFERAARLAAGGFASKPQIVQRRVSRNRILLSVHVLLFANGKVAALIPRTFSLVREAGEWRIADLEYFDVKAQEGRDAERRAGRRDSGPSQ